MRLPRWLLADRAGFALLSALVVLGIGVPVLNLLVPPCRLYTFRCV